MRLNALPEPAYRDKLLSDLESIGSSLETIRLNQLVQWAYDLLDAQVGTVTVGETILELHEEYGYDLSGDDELF